MKNIFNISEQNEILQRLEKINYQSINQSGKMNPAQMLAHCIQPIQVAMGETEIPSNLIRFINKLILNKNEATSKEYIGAEAFEKEKKKLIIIFEKLISNGKSAIKTEKLPFFLFSGRVSADKWAQINFTHIDHHLRQFEV